MRIICENVGKNVSISVGTTYDVISETEKRYTIINDKGIEKNYCKSLFRTVRNTRRNNPVPQPAPEPVAPPRIHFNELNIEVRLNGNNVIIEATNSDRQFNHSIEIGLNCERTSISCGIHTLTSLNILLNSITSFKRDVLNSINTLCQRNDFVNEITEEDINTSAILEEVLNLYLERQQGDNMFTGLLLLSTNITNNNVITPEYIEVLDRISVYNVETHNPNSSNRIKMWTLQLTE